MQLVGYSRRLRSTRYSLELTDATDEDLESVEELHGVGGDDCFWVADSYYNTIVLFGMEG